MDIFRSVVVALALILFLFMTMIIYYEFTISQKNMKFPPYKYSKSCPDNSVEKMVDGSVTSCTMNWNSSDYDMWSKTIDKDKIKDCLTGSAPYIFNISNTPNYTASDCNLV